MVEEYYIVDGKSGSGKRYAKYILYGILAFLAIYFPFFGGAQLRFQLSQVFRLIFDTIGMLCVFGGVIFILLGILGLFGRRLAIGKLVIGVLLLWIGCWMTGIAFSLLGVDFGGSSASLQGYH
ncbi:MAG: membrane protein of unknown function [Promethearchaeota archaeon]|nr:MAG: membrane protein of unknown function [Candidatus Lokiarchaeota archaeon]